MFGNFLATVIPNNLGSGRVFSPSGAGTGNASLAPEDGNLFAFVTHLKQALHADDPLQPLGLTAETSADADTSNLMAEATEAPLTPEALAALLDQLKATLESLSSSLPPTDQTLVTQAMTDIENVQASLPGPEANGPEPGVVDLVSDPDTAPQTPQAAIAAMLQALPETTVTAINTLLNPMFQRNEAVSRANATDTLERVLPKLPIAAQDSVSTVLDRLKSAPETADTLPQAGEESQATPTLHAHVALARHAETLHEKGSKAMETLESVIAKAPPAAQAALQSVLAKQQNATPEGNLSPEAALQAIQTALENAPPKALDALQAVLNKLQMVEAPAVQSMAEQAEPMLGAPPAQGSVLTAPTPPAPTEQPIEAPSLVSTAPDERIPDEAASLPKGEKTTLEPKEPTASQDTEPLDATQNEAESSRQHDQGDAEPHPKDENRSPLSESRWVVEKLRSPKRQDSLDNVSPREKAIVQIETLIDKVPEKAKASLTQVLTKLKALSETASEKATPKSVHQVQVELAFEHRPAPQAEPLPTMPVSMTADPLEKPVSVTPALEAPATLGTSDTTVEGLGKSAEHRADAAMPEPHEQVIQAAKLNLNGGRKELTIQLRPDNLGDVRLTLNSNARNEVSARLITETAEARESLEKHMDQLMRSLEASGLKLGKITVVQAGSESSANRDNHANPNAEQQQNANSGSSQHQQHAHKHPSNFAQAFMNFDSQQSRSFKDEGSFPSRNETSSPVSFDTDVEGEEVSAGQPTPSGAIDIRA